MDAPNNWKSLIDQATRHEAEMLAKVTNAQTSDKTLKVLAK